jgi:hypothetical protein
MVTFLDDVAVDLPGESLAAQLAAARDSLSPKGRMVVEVKVDGQTLDPDRLEAEQGEPVSGELRIYSADPRALVIPTVEQARDQLVEAAQWQEEAADLLQQDNAAEAMKLIGQAFNAWQQTQQVVQQSAALLQIDLDDLELGGHRMPELVQALLEQLKALRDLIVANDTVALADVLAYEWPGTNETWIQVLDHFIQLLKQPGDGEA